MKMKNTGEFVGYSDTGIEDAIEKAKEQAGEQQRFVVVETLGESSHQDKNKYKVTLKASAE